MTVISRVFINKYCSDYNRLMSLGRLRRNSMLNNDKSAIMQSYHLLREMVADSLPL